jgi:ribosomal protein L37AE/L43A
MHYGEIEHRSVYGEATPDQAKELHEEGSSFTRCRHCRTSGTDQQPTSTWSWQCITCAFSMPAKGLKDAVAVYAPKRVGVRL